MVELQERANGKDLSPPVMPSEIRGPCHVEWYEYSKHFHRLGDPHGPYVGTFLQQPPGPATALLAPDESVICVIGCTPFWAGMAEAWMFTSVLVKKYPKTSTRFVKNSIQASMDLLHLRLVAITVQ